MIILFIISPKLKRIPAQNLGGEGWKKKRTSINGVTNKRIEANAGSAQRRTEHGELKVSFASDGTDLLMLASIVAYTVEGQKRCRKQLAETTGEVIDAEMPPTLGERKVAKAAERQRSNTF